MSGVCLTPGSSHNFSDRSIEELMSCVVVSCSRSCHQFGAVPADCTRLVTPANLPARQVELQLCISGVYFFL